MSAVTSPETGFTLIEGIVASLISVILVGVLLTILTMNNSGVKNGAINTQVQAQYEIAIEQIAAAARKATAILAGGETWPPTAGMAATTTSKIEMYYQDAVGNVTRIRGFKVDGGVLKECSSGFSDADYIPFKVGSWPALSVLDASPFTLTSNRKSVTVSMRVCGVFSGDSAIAPARGEVFTCRN